MKKSKKISFVIRFLATGLGFFFVMKGQATELFKKIRWTASSEPNRKRPDLQILGSSSRGSQLGPLNGLLPRENVKLSSDFERVHRSSSKISSALVRGTWRQTVVDARDQVVSDRGVVLESYPEHFKVAVENEFSRRDEMLSAFASQSQAYRQASFKAAPQLEVVISDESNLYLEWIVEFMSADETEVFRSVLNSDHKLIFTKKIGHHAVQGIASVFPKGPKRGALQSVTLNNLDGSGRLRTDKVQVLSASVDPVQSSSFDYRFAEDDARFDQVQAYFFADQILKFFKSRFDSQPLMQLEIKVQVGDQSNAAYYFANKIRLGAGDQIRFQNMAQDPSIVMHEVAHAIIANRASLPSDGEGGSLNEAFADFFTASLLDSPRMGESAFLQGPFVRNLENNYTVSGDLGSDLYRASLVISGTFWDLRSALSAAKAEDLAFRTLSRLGPGARFADFVPAVLAATPRQWDPAETAKLREILNARGWAL